MINWPQIVNKKRRAKPDKIPLYYFKGEKAKAPNTRLQLKAFDGFSSEGKRCKPVYSEGCTIDVPQRYLSFIF